MGGLNSATEPQAHGVSVRLLFNLQHWSTIPFSRGRALSIRVHGPPGEAVGIDNANPSESASIPGSKVRTSLVAPLNQFTHVCMARAICKQLKQNGQHRFLVLHLRQNDEGLSQLPNSLNLRLAVDFRSRRQRRLSDIPDRCPVNHTLRTASSIGIIQR
jgi:hypothetical protein